MKKLVIFPLMLITAFVLTPVAKANSSSATAVSESTQFWEGQQRRGRGRGNDRRWNNRRPITYYQTRIVRRWGRTYRETIRVTRLPNGRVQTKVVSRVRIR
ncbi:hypothetical protein [Leptolyngbya sp. 7M]|uniref:hypothetical protein n=1 Tax=Leptolyngbya sp. 7M TaxID=2812896 RepID=UPI001B8D8884|nr:hypothetical protein [Leptolyngbya sp. 7M]QYO66727.1 hypothetical protein JVX88_07960 [Leptolyngbya sp. 7M]